MSITKTILIISILTSTTLQAPRSLRGAGAEGNTGTGDAKTEEVKKDNAFVITMHEDKHGKTLKKQTKPVNSSMDWTVTTTQELTNSIAYIKETITPGTGGQSSEEKKELLKSLQAKEHYTKHKISQSKKEGDKAYNEASFSVNRLSMAVKWYKFAHQLLAKHLETMATQSNYSYKEFKALEDKTKELLFYEVYAYACTCYPDPTAQVNEKEMDKLVKMITSQVDKEFKDKIHAQEQKAKEHKAQEHKSEEHRPLHKGGHKDQEASVPATAAVITPAVAPATNPPSEVAAKLWSEIKGLKTQQIEQSIANQRNMQQLQKDLIAAQNSLSGYKNNLEKASKQTATLQEKVEKTCSEKLEKTIEIAKLEKRMEAIEKANQVQSDHLNAEISKLSDEVSEKEKTIAKLSAQKNKYESKFQDLEATLTKLKQEDLEHSIELKSVKNKRAKTEGHLIKQKEELEKKIAHFIDKQKTQEMEIVSKRIAIQKLEQELKHKEIELIEKKLALGHKIHHSGGMHQHNKTKHGQSATPPTVTPATSNPPPAPAVTVSTTSVSVPATIPAANPVQTQIPTAAVVTATPTTPSSVAPVKPLETSPNKPKVADSLFFNH